MQDQESSDSKEVSKEKAHERSNSQRLAMLALGISILAVVLAVSLPQVMPPAYQGPLSTHTDLNYLPSGLILPPAPACTHVARAEVTMAVPSAGAIVVSATGRALINHTRGYGDVMSLFFGNSSAGCDYPFAWITEVPASWDSEPYFDVTYSLQTTFTVSRGGTYTLYLNGQMWQGGDLADRILTASLVAVFYPK